MAIIDIYVPLLVFVINVIYTFFFYNKYALYVSITWFSVQYYNHQWKPANKIIAHRRKIFIDTSILKYVIICKMQMKTTYKKNVCERVLLYVSELFHHKHKDMCTHTMLLGKISKVHQNHNKCYFVCFVCKDQQLL
jgi:hypothetical protein